MHNRKLVINSAYYTLGEILPRVITLFLLPVLTRYLSPAEYGINSYTNTIMLFSFVLSSLSLNTFLLRNYYKETGPDDKKRLTGNVFVLMLTTNGLLTGLELLAFPFLLDRLKIRIPFYPFFLLAILNNFLEGISIVPLIVYRVHEKARQFVMINATKTFLQFIVTVILLTRFHYGLTGVYLSRLFVNILYTVFFLAVVFQNAVFQPDRAQFKKAFAFSLPLLPGALSYLFISSFDRIMLEKNLGLTDLGLYSSAATLSLTLNIVIQGLYRSFEQKIFKEHDSAEYATVTDTLYRYFLLALLTGGFLLAIFSREVFLIFTSRKYLEAYKLVGLLVVPVIISGLNTFLGTLLIADHKQRIITRVTLLSLVITFAGNIALIRIWGVYGAILTSVLSFASVSFFYFLNVRLKNRRLVPLFLLLVLALVLSLMQEAFTLPLAYSILLKGVCSLLYFRVCLLLFGIKPAALGISLKRSNV